MKNFKLLSLSLVLIVSSLMLIQCTSEPIPGPAGIDGTNGLDGQDGIDGVDGTTSCVACHTDSHREPIENSYDSSSHFIQTKVSWAGDVHLSEYVSGLGSDNDFSCARCHTNEGFIEYQTTGTIKGYFDNPKGISCTGCHTNHDTFDFENDGQDYALRTTDPVDLIINKYLPEANQVILDFEGTSNTCAQCHQPRKVAPSDQGGGLYTITPHYGSHGGAQSTMLEGIQGAEISGSESYPAVASSTHRNNASCVSCHMGEPNDNDGQHTMKPTLNKCLDCHSSATSFDVNGVQTEVANLLQELEDLLITKGILEVSPWGGIDLVTGDHPVGVAEAYWNWEFVHQDGSHGVHNPAYTKALLKNSIASLQD